MKPEPKLIELRSQVPIDERLRKEFMEAPVAVAVPSLFAVISGHDTHGGLLAFIIQQKQLKAADMPRDCVALFVNDGSVYIRNDRPPDIILAADDLLQKFVDRGKIKFLDALDPADQRLRIALKQRGQISRFALEPFSKDELEEQFKRLRTSIAGLPIYYYNPKTGERFITLEEFRKMGDFSCEELRQHLCELQSYAAETNEQGRHEVSFFMSGTGPTGQSFTQSDLLEQDANELDEAHLRAWHRKLAERFQAAVCSDCQRDDPKNEVWRSAMAAALFNVALEERAMGLAPEFHHKVRWHPGATVSEQGRLLFDGASPVVVRSLIGNYESRGDLEYINVGDVVESMSRRVPKPGRRKVMLVQAKYKDQPRETIKILRFSKWDIEGRLKSGKPLLDAMCSSEEYVEFVLDRALGCRELGMRLAHSLAGRVAERAQDSVITSSYFERNYLRGVATDKVPLTMYGNARFVLELMRLLGRAAAANLIVGRCAEDGQTYFDDGDEILPEAVLENPDGPFPCNAEIIVSDNTGSFREFTKPLPLLIASYVDVVTRRKEHIQVHFANREADELMGEARHLFLSSLCDRFKEIRDEYLARQADYRQIFSHRRQEEGSFAYRWLRVLNRLGSTKSEDLVNSGGVQKRS